MLGRTRIGAAAFARQHEQHLARAHRLPLLNAHSGDDASLAGHDAYDAAGRQQHALRLRLASGAEEDEKRHDGQRDGEEQPGQEYMADGPRKQYGAVLFIAQMLEGLLAEQGLPGRCWGAIGWGAGLIAQDNILFELKP